MDLSIPNVFMGFLRQDLAMKLKENGGTPEQLKHFVENTTDGDVLSMALFEEFIPENIDHELFTEAMVGYIQGVLIENSDIIEDKKLISECAFSLSEIHGLGNCLLESEMDDYNKSRRAMLARMKAAGNDTSTHQAKITGPYKNSSDASAPYKSKPSASAAAVTADAQKREKFMANRMEESGKKSSSDMGGVGDDIQDKADRQEIADAAGASEAGPAGNGGKPTNPADTAGLWTKITNWMSTGKVGEARTGMSDFFEQHKGGISVAVGVALIATLSYAAYKYAKKRNAGKANQAEAAQKARIDALRKSKSLCAKTKNRTECNKKIDAKIAKLQKK